MARMMGASTSALAERYIATGEATRTDIDQYILNSGDQRFWTVYYTTVSLIATK